MRRFSLPFLTCACALISAPALGQSLDAAIADALAHAPSVAEAQAGEAAAKARLDRARAEHNPLLRVEGTVGVGRIDNGGFFGITADNVTPLAVTATGEMPLYTGGRIAAAMAQARGGADVARLQAEQTRLQTVVQTVAAYAEVLTARKLDTRFGQLVSQLREVERQEGLRYRAGEVASSDVARARARRAEAEAGQVQAQGRRMSAEAAYLRLTGKAPSTLSALPAEPATPPTVEEALDLARNGNPAIRQASAAIIIAKAAVRAAQAEGMPTLGAYAEAAHVRDQFFPNYRADSASVGVRGRWTLFSGGRVAAQVRAAQADAAAADARARQASDTLDGMVIDAWVGLQTARRMVAATELRHSAAQEALRGTRLEFKVGAKPTLAVLDAEREAIEAEAALIEAQGMRQVAAWRLKALTGDAAP